MTELSQSTLSFHKIGDRTLIWLLSTLGGILCKWLEPQNQDATSEGQGLEPVGGLASAVMGEVTFLQDIPKGLHHCGSSLSKGTGILPQRADCPSTSDQLHPPVLLSLLSKTTALLRPNSTPHPVPPTHRKGFSCVLAEMCNHLHTSEDVFSPLKINPGHMSSHLPTLVSPLNSRQRWPNCQTNVCLDTSGGEVFKSHISPCPPPFFLVHGSAAEIVCMVASSKPVFTPLVGLLLLLKVLFCARGNVICLEPW